MLLISSYAMNMASKGGDCMLMEISMRLVGFGALFAAFLVVLGIVCFAEYLQRPEKRKYNYLKIAEFLVISGMVK